MTQVPAISRRKFVLGTAAALGSTQIPLSKARGQTKLEDRDVCIIGGGASGMYALNWLSKNSFDCALIERKNRIGGHAETYRKPGVQGHLDMGVRIYPNESLIKDMLDDFDVAYSKVNVRNNKLTYLDFETGENSPFKQPNNFKILYAMLKYNRLFSKHFKYLEDPGFQIPDNAPAELWMPFGEFLKRHGLESGYSSMINYLQGFGKVAELPTIYAIKNLRPVILNNFMMNSYIAPDDGVDVLYDRMSDFYSDNIRLETEVLSVVRGDEDKHYISVQGPDGVTTIRAKHIIVTCPPIIENMAQFDLDAQEKELMSKFRYNNYFTAAVEIDGMPEKQLIFNGGKNGPLSAMKERGIYGLFPTEIKGVTNILYGTDHRQSITEDDVLRDMIYYTEKVSPNVLGNRLSFSKVNLLLSHTPYLPSVSVDELKDGFYNKFDRLQGHRNTIYLGAALDTHGTFAVWRHADFMLNRFFSA